MITPRFRHLPLQLRPLVDKFYRDHRSPMRSQAGDELWVTESANQIVATLSLRPLAGGQWLTGLFVAPALRRQGVAAALLDHSLALHPEPVWLFCHPELRGFYQRLGFEDCQSLPTELAVRLTRYQRNKSLVSLRIH
ncbi:GNAT family N-acetyltransferase [Ectopseudomonas oleovorans]|uniref:GNAT family N-acetyltransferase n=1 Tax=Ectopseudomonas oleovorans TaxID=301 RepID=UPI00241D710E|nr:GNAT family N-acetyltransferase [Pseudomonas oleovorans]